MPRDRKLSKDSLHEASVLRKLREAMKIPRTEFSAILGLVGTVLVNRELGLTPWHPKELEAAKRKIREHLGASLKAFEATFKEPAFPSAIPTAIRTAMKLPPLSAENRARAQTALDQLDAVLAGLPQFERKVTALHSEAAGIDREEESFRASRKHDKTTVQNLQACGMQRSLIGERIVEAETELRARCGAACEIVASAARLVCDLLEPLSAELSKKLVLEQVALLKPYGVPVAQSARMVNFDDTPCGELLAAVRMRHFRFGGSRPADTPADTIRLAAEERRALLRNILAGEDVFTFPLQPAGV